MESKLQNSSAQGTTGLQHALICFCLFRGYFFRFPIRTRRLLDENGKTSKEKIGFKRLKATSEQSKRSQIGLRGKSRKPVSLNRLSRQKLRSLGLIRCGRPRNEESIPCNRRWSTSNPPSKVHHRTGSRVDSLS